MKKLAVLLIVAAFVGTAFFAIAADKPAKVTFEVKMGNVTFDHAKHEGLTDCATCHHTGDQQSCKSCHQKKAGDAPKSKDAFHKNCKDCHKKEGKGPTKCKECHVK